MFTKCLIVKFSRLIVDKIVEFDMIFINVTLMNVIDKRDIEIITLAFYSNS